MRAQNTGYSTVYFRRIWGASNKRLVLLPRLHSTTTNPGFSVCSPDPNATRSRRLDCCTRRYYRKKNTIYYRARTCTPSNRTGRVQIIADGRTTAAESGPRGRHTAVGWYGKPVLLFPEENTPECTPPNFVSSFNTSFSPRVGVFFVVHGLRASVDISS